MGESLNGQTVLVTGASGFIGAHLSRRLLAEGADVHAVSRSRHDNETANFRWWAVDLADCKTVHEIVRQIRPQTVFHLASEVTGKQQLDYVLPTLRGNLMSTVNLMVSAAETDCKRFITTGSMDEPEPRDACPVPCSPYAAAKQAASAYARMFHSLYGFPAVVLRVFMVYGPGQQDMKLIPYVILSLLRGQSPAVMSGERLVDWIYIDDVVEAIVRSAVAENVDGLTIDLGSGKQLAVRELVNQIASIMASDVLPTFSAVSDRTNEHIRVANPQTALRLLGWSSKISLEEGLNQTVRWYGRTLEKR